MICFSINLLQVCAYPVCYSLITNLYCMFVSPLRSDRTSCVVSGSKCQRQHPMSMSPRSRSSNVHRREGQRVPLRPHRLRERWASTNRVLILISGALSTRDDLFFHSCQFHDVNSISLVFFFAILNLLVFHYTISISRLYAPNIY